MLPHFTTSVLGLSRVSYTSIMKRLVLILSIILCSLTVFAQNYTRKWNQYLNRYEYYQGNTLVQIAVYNPYLKQWEYTDMNQPKVGTKQEWEVYTPYDTKGLGTIIQQKQAAYDRNYAAVLQAVTRLNTAIQNVNGLTNQQQANIDKFYQWLNQSCQGDLSGNSLTNNIIYYINNKINEVTKWKKTPTECEDGTIYTTPDGKNYVCYNGKLVEYNYDPMTGKPVNRNTPQAKTTQPAQGKTNYKTGQYEVLSNSPVLQEPKPESRQVAKVNQTVTILYKANATYYKVRLPDGTEGYLNETWIKKQ
jgi:hypothetical protein